MIFPVKIPYTIAPDILKYNGDPYEKELIPFYIEEKKRELSLHRHNICCEVDHSSPFIEAFRDFCGLKGILNIEEMAMHFNEDIAILKNGIVKAICFCFPSSFFPSHLLDKSFFAMHQPVPENENLLRASDKIVELISEKNKMFRRYVWTISSLSTLSQLPSYNRIDPVKIEDLYFRNETQTTVGLGDGISLFFVKVQMTPLSILWNDSEKKNQIIESIHSMTPSILEYKNLIKIKEILINH
ncbi:MAG: heme-dependent oxidative N-demethylase subunit alpha family protein [Chitinophagaceae bacterium]